VSSAHSAFSFLDRIDWRKKSPRREALNIKNLEFLRGISWSKEENILNKVIILVAVFFAAISLIFSSCTPGVKNPPPTNDKNVPQESSRDKVKSPKSSQQEKPQYTKLKVVESWEEYEASDLPLISAIPDKKIYLYAIKPKGVVLYFEGKGHYYNWEYMTPRFILPEIKVGDYDKDGKDELSIIPYVGAGTGYSVEDLHIIELSEREILSNDPTDKNYFVPNPEYFKDNFYKPDDYVKQINKLVTLKTYYKENGELTGNVMTGEESHEISLKGLQSGSNQVTVTGLYFGDIVEFDAEADKLTVKMAVGVTTQSRAVPYYVGEIHADENYKAGNFTMSNPKFMPQKQ